MINLIIRVYDFEKQVGTKQAHFSSTNRTKETTTATTTLTTTTTTTITKIFQMIAK